MASSEPHLSAAPETRSRLIAGIAVLAILTFLIDLSLPSNLAGGLGYGVPAGPPYLWRAD